MSKQAIYTGIRLDNGESVTGELFTWEKYQHVAIICEDCHERISQGHRVDPFNLVSTPTTLKP